MAYEFAPKSKKRRKAGGQALDDKNIADRVKREQERMQHATDSEFWLCLCFKCEADRIAFLVKTGLPGDKKFISGKALRAAVARYKPGELPKVFAKKTRGALKANNPLANVGMSASMEADCKAETSAILDAFRAIDIHDEYREASDSHIWICAAFYDREDVEGFLDEYGLRKFGDKYLDASGWLEQLG